LLERLANALSGVTVCCSKSEMEVFVSHNIAARYINNGAEPRDFVALPGTEEIFIVNSGRICYQKNPELFNLIAKKFTDRKEVRFVWIGDGEMREKLTSPNIEITGWVSQEEALRTIRQSHVFLSTSLWEGLSLAILEAMMIGRTMVLRTCTGNVDLVFQGDNGFLFNDEDDGAEKIRYFLDNPGMLVEMGMNSHNICTDKFNIHQTATQYRHYYAEHFQQSL